MGDAPTLIYDICEDLRKMTVHALADGGCDEPGRSYVEIGNTLAPVEFGDDCTSQLTVTAGPLSPDLVTDLVQRRQGKASCAMLWRCRFDITLLRPHPMWSGDEGAPLPSREQTDAEARAHYADGWQVARALSWRWAHGQLVPAYTFDCENTQWSGVTVRPPQGGIRGWDLTLFVSVHDQFEPEAITPPFDEIE